MAVDAVKKWLGSTGVVDPKDIILSTNKQWLAFTVTVADAEALLFAEYHVYEHSSTGIQNVGCNEYHIPHNISNHVDYITPGIVLLSHGYSPDTMKQAKRDQLQRQKLDKRVTDVMTADGPSRLAMAAPAEDMSYQATPPRVVPVFGCDLYTTAECTRGKINRLGAHKLSLSNMIMHAICLQCFAN